MALKIKKSLATHQPTKAEMEEVTAVRGTPDQITRAVLSGGAPRQESGIHVSVSTGNL